MVRKKIGVVMETIQEKIEKSFKENSPRIAIKKGEKNTTYSELYNEVKILSFNISNVWPEQRKYLLVWCDEIENTINKRVLLIRLCQGVDM